MPSITTPDSRRSAVAEFCPLCEHRVHRDHRGLVDRPVLRTIARWNRAIDDAVERATDWLAHQHHGELNCYCDATSAGRGFGWSGDLCDCCHPSHAH